MLDFSMRILLSVIEDEIEYTVSNYLNYKVYVLKLIIILKWRELQRFNAAWKLMLLRLSVSRQVSE